MSPDLISAFIGALYSGLCLGPLADEYLHPGNKVPGAEGFCDVIVDPAQCGSAPVALTASGREHYYWDGGGGWIAP